MKIGFVADVHVGNHKRFGGPMKSGINARCSETLQVLERAVTKANEEGCEMLVVLGDLLDTSHPEPQVLAEVQRVLGPIPTLLLLGNHEQESSAEGDHALGPLEPVASVIARPEIFVPEGEDALEVWCVPFQPGNARDWLPGVLVDLHTTSKTDAKGGARPPQRVLALHLGISDDDTPPWLQGAHDSIPASVLGEMCAEHDINFVFTGNWHEHKFWLVEGVKVLQVGALVPTGFDNPGLKGYGAMVVFDSAHETFVPHEIPGPRFLKLKWPLESLATAVTSDSYVSFSAPLEELEAARAFLADGIARKKFRFGEVTPDAVESKVAARTAATVARSAETMDQAIVGFIEAMVLPEGVDRASVAQRVRGYLARRAE